MALGKSIRQETGFDSNYWYIGNIQQDRKARIYTVTLYGYSDEDKKSNEPIAARVLQVATGDDFKPDMSIKELYGLVKAHPDWEDAIDL